MNLSELNTQQRQAVTNTKGPMLVIAGAGSGKTKVLTSRVAYLVGEENASPYSILAITFTNKAANEMKERIEKAIDMEVSRMWISTFHAMCVRILRYDGKAIGYDSNFVIYDTDDTLKLIKDILSRLDLKDDKNYPPRLVRSAISKFKNTCPGGDIFEFADKNYPSLSYRIKEIYELYISEMENQKAMDFDDLLLNVLKMFKEHPDVLDRYQERFKYILVDEYQDTNMVQYELVKLLASKYKNIFVVGDDDQSIYAFRGANIENILNFEKDYPNAKVIRLEQNYRSDINILEAANSVIKNNMGRRKKRLWSEIETGEKPKVYNAKSEYDEAEFIAREINDLVRQGKNYGDIAILYRAHTLARIIEEKLRMYSVPYRVYGGLSFYERKEIKDIIAYLNLIVNPAADISLTRIINVPKRSIGQTSVQKLAAIAHENNIPMMQAIKFSEQFLQGCSFKKKTDAFYNMFFEIAKDYKEKEIHQVIEDVFVGTGYKEMLETEYADDCETRIENVQELINSAYEFEKDNDDATLDDFMQNIALISDMDSMDEGGGVTLMTIHAAKGLEFDTVFVAGMEENIFPSKMSLDEGNDEEERRLCYVAITRAKRHLYLTNSCKRAYFGDMAYNPPSRFLNEIDDDMLEFLNKSVSFEAPQKQEYKISAPKFFAGNIKTNTVKKPPKAVSGNFKVGMTVAHKTFGRGKILSIAGEGNQQIATVDFDKAGQKKMFLAFAPLDIVG